MKTKHWIVCGISLVVAAVVCGWVLASVNDKFQQEERAKETARQERLDQEAADNESIRVCERMLEKANGLMKRASELREEWRQLDFESPFDPATQKAFKSCRKAEEDSTAALNEALEEMKKRNVFILEDGRMVVKRN